MATTDINDMLNQTMLHPRDIVNNGNNGTIPSQTISGEEIPPVQYALYKMPHIKIV